MQDVAHTIIREPGEETPEQYARRVRFLAAIYAVMSAASIIGLALVVQWGKYFVTLTQRSNIETLVLLFLIGYFGYFLLLSWPGTFGGMRIAYFGLRARLGSLEDAERRKVRALGMPKPGHPVVAINCLLERDDRPREGFSIDVADEYGSMGRIDVSGARITYVQAHRGGVTSLLIYFVHQANQLLAEDGAESKIDIVEWGAIDEDALKGYLGLIEFARNVERHLDMEEGWPKLLLTADQVAALERRLSEVCRALRSEMFLPEWEFSGDHKLPLIPEPLGLFSLSRSEKRIDPISSMGFAAAIVVTSTIALALLIVVPPWVPGA
ncbi:MAG TPA: hypothetical protein VI759_03550 [Dehalococcoidia bacterium]|nr:hypothetical protein [Dehalococcoidia bacterium]